MSTIAALAAWLVTVALIAAAVALGLATSGISVAGQSTALDTALLASPVLFTYATVGALLAARRPRNPIGWLLVLTALGGASGISLHGYDVLKRGTVDAALPYVVWLSPQLGTLMLTSPLLVVTLFPSGAPRSRIERVAVGLVLGAAALQLAKLFIPGEVGQPPVANPFGIPALAPLLPAVEDAGIIALVLAFLAALASLVIRYRASGGIERLQMKWPLYVSLLTGAAVLAVLALLTVGKPDQALALGVAVIFLVGLGLMPVSVAIAILRYRLYDIDVLINRTLVYGAVTATLLATYVATVFLLQQVLSRLTLGNDLAVAASTLLIAALFQPVRRRIQNAVDHRFYRRKYDAEKTVAAFSAHLRQEIDLDSIVGELTAVANEAVQPAHASVWLRGRSNR